MKKPPLAWTFAAGATCLAALCAGEEPKAVEIEPAVASRLVSLHCREAPFPEVVRYLSSLARVGITLDPKLDPAGLPPVTFDLKQVPLREVLNRLAQLAPVEAQWQSGGYVLAARQAAGEKPVPGAAASVTEAQRREIEQDIGSLGSEQYETREAARRRLLHAGKAALPLLEAALKAAQTDLQLAARMDKLISDLKGPRPEDGADAAPPGRQVGMDFVNTSLAQVAQTLGGLFPGTRFKVDPSLADRLVTVSVRAQSLDQVLRAMARAARVKVVQDTVRVVAPGVAGGERLTVSFVPDDRK